MQAYQVDESTGSRLMGGDMLEWSDLQGVPTLTAVGYLVSRLIRDRRPRSVLLVGARAASLLDGLPTALEVDALVRALPDARSLSALGGLRSHLRIYCGGFDYFDSDNTYDLVVCLDGPESLLTPDSRGMSHRETLTQVAALAGERGVVVAAVPNELGLDHLFRLELRSLYDGDEQWYRGAPGFDARRPFPRELAGLLQDAGLQTDQRYSVFPSPSEPSLLADDTALADPVASAHVAALVHATEGRHFSERPALVDPYQLSRTMVEAGMAFELAPMWIAVARRAGQESPLRLPSVIAGEDGTRPEWTAVTTLATGDDGWDRQVHCPRGVAMMNERRVGRDLESIAHEVPPGRVLEADLRIACAGSNIGAVRTLVQRYAAWLGDDAAWAGADTQRRFFATPDNVVVGEGDALTLFDPSWFWSEQVSHELAVLRGLRVFARRLLRSGGEHPWKPDISPDALTQTLAAMAGLTWTPADAAQIAEREAELQVAVFGGNGLDENNAYSTNIESGLSQFTSTPGPSRGYRESLDLTGRMSSELFDRGGQVDWLERTVKQRDVQVGELENTLTSVRGSVSFKIGRGVTFPGRAVVKSGRRAALSALPPGLLPRAQRIAQKFLNQR